MNLEESRKARLELSKRAGTTLNNMKKIEEESLRVADVAHNAGQVLDNLDEEFERKTELKGIDISFLFLATALQCVRKYMFTNFKERVNDQEGAKNTGKQQEHSNRMHQWYHPSLQDIINNPVPFDATFCSPDFHLDIGGGFNHRARTLGHDPILGWFFGTMNILTSTLTTSDFQ